MYFALGRAKNSPAWISRRRSWLFGYGFLTLEFGSKFSVVTVATHHPAHGLGSEMHYYNVSKQKLEAASLICVLELRIVDPSARKKENVLTKMR